MPKAVTLRGSVLFGRPVSEVGLKTLPFQLVLNSGGGIGIAVDSYSHPVERAWAALEHKHREIPLTQDLGESIRIFFLLHGRHLKYESGKV